MRTRDFQDWSRDYEGTGRRRWRDRLSEEEGDDRRYRGRESYEQQYRAGQGGMSDMWDRPSYPRDHDDRDSGPGYAGRERDWDSRYRAGEDERYAERNNGPDYERGRPEPERGSNYGYRRDERGSYGNEPARRWAQPNRDFGYGNRFARDERDDNHDANPRGFGSGAYERRSSFGGGAYEGGFGGGMSLDDGRFITRSSYGAGQPQRRTGNAPKGYRRSDDRIREDVCDRLSERWDVESQAIEVSVSNGEVTLSGSVPERGMKFRAESISDGVSGVSEVHNQLRVAQQPAYQGQARGEQGTGNGGSAESFKSNAPHAGRRS